MFLPQLLIFFHGFVSLKGVSWPSGAYGIPQSQVGCPDEEGVKWQTGWRRQHLEKQNQIPKPSHLNVSLVLNGQGIERSFCIKTISNNTEERNTLWQAGRYCIYKYGESCPQGLKTGYFRWDDVNNNNHSYGGILPAGSYNNDATTIEYCCQDGGNVNEPIELPIDKPFYLLPYNLAFCQHVKWTVRTLEMVVYDTENLKNNDSSEGHHAHVNRKKSLVTAYYCYYKACRVTLRKTTGSFESYNSAHQYCSWAIVAREMSVISLKLTELSIPDCQLNNLDIYEGHDEKGVLLARYCGSNATKSVSLNSTGNALFVMLKSGGNFDGLTMKFVKLKAEYTTKACQCHVELGPNAAKNGSFTSPMYPSENYPHHQNCSWKVMVKENHFISLTFDYFYLPNCNDTYVKIYNGPSTLSPLLTKLCDTETATRSIWNSTGKSLYIVYKTGGRSRKGIQKITGFSANYIKLQMFKVLPTTKQDIKCLPTTEKPSVETTLKLLETTHDTLNPLNSQSSRSNKVTVIVMASVISVVFLLLVMIFFCLYIKRRGSPFNQFLSKTRRNHTRKESVNPIYGQVTKATSSQNPLYSSTSIPVYEEANVKRDFLISVDKDQVSFSSQAKTNKPNGANEQHHYEIPKFG